MAYITLNKANFFHNLDIITQKTQSKTKVALVLKDNAYGHGIEKIATLAQSYGITRAVVRTYAEAQQIADFFSNILILSEMPQKLLEEKFCITINDITQIKKLPPLLHVALKVDTGMHRNGIAMGNISEAFRLIQKQKLHLKEVFTHHRSADSLTSEWFWQNENFKKVKEQVKKLSKKYNIPLPLFHSANSASLFRTHTFDEAYARIGIAAYGLLEGEVFHPLPLKPILSLYATKLSTQQLQKNMCIGYNASWCAGEKMEAGCYDVGYGDGFFRSLSNNYTTPDGATLLGRVSMDNTTFCTTKGELLIFDDAREVAKKVNTISYEVVTSLKEYIERKII